MGEFSVWHWIIVAIVFLALFGYKKLPDAARSMGRSMRIFKAEMNQMRDDVPVGGTSAPSASSTPSAHPADARPVIEPAGAADQDSVAPPPGSTGADAPHRRGS